LRDTFGLSPFHASGRWQRESILEPSPASGMKGHAVVEGRVRGLFCTRIPPHVIIKTIISARTNGPPIYLPLRGRKSYKSDALRLLYWYRNIDLRELFVRFMAMGCRKCYTIEYFQIPLPDESK
jgi:hypothetical protein